MESATFYALITGLVIIATPMLIISALAITFALIVAPVVLRVIAPCKNMGGKLVSITALAALVISWLVMRGQPILSGKYPISKVQFATLDLLLLVAWIGLAASLFVWPGYTKTIAKKSADTLVK